MVLRFSGSNSSTQLPVLALPDCIAVRAGLKMRADMVATPFVLCAVSRPFSQKCGWGEGQAAIGAANGVSLSLFCRSSPPNAGRGRGARGRFAWQRADGAGLSQLASATRHIDEP